MAVIGIRWRTGISVCTVPVDMAAHKLANAKGSYRVNSYQSALILEETKILGGVPRIHVEYVLKT